ncbi:MAG: hypothetical protein HY043_15290 [Verrucomicrobia bacterium]|nr:hypothetical protein [Verrucomicrobiota bacterium]
MKLKILSRVWAATAGVAWLGVAIGSMAAESDSTGTPAHATNEPTAAVQLSFGEQEVLKLVRAKISDALVQTYVEKTPANYDLSAAAIVYLREQGVSDPVLTAMLKQRKKTTETTAQLAPTPAPANAAPPATPPPAQTYVAEAPSYVPAATVYVAPPATTYVYYDSYPGYPRYYGYYGWYVPPVSLSFGFGRGYRAGYYGGYRGGFHGGGHVGPVGGGHVGGVGGGGHVGGGGGGRHH